MAEPPIPPAFVKGRIKAPHAQGLRRARLVRPLVKPGAPRLALVVAPAGSGKSTLLAHVAEAVDCPVAWLTLDGATGDVADLLAHLRAAFAAVLPGLAPAWPSAECALVDLEQVVTAPLLLVLDDLHAAAPGAIRDVVGLFIDYQPEPLRIVLGSRRAPDLDIARRRLTGSMVEVDADALRFRTWEVDELFRQHHQVQLRPKEVSALTQRTAGWAAGLQLFHLATHRQPPSTRAALLAKGGTGSRLTQEYLARHVLNRVAPDVRSFLVRTSVLDELTARRCDALLGTSDAGERLAELEHSGLFTFTDVDGLIYRYHEVLRGHLLDELVTRFGLEQAHTLHAEAARLLEAEGALGEAIRSYCRAGAWEDIRRLLASGGASLARQPGTWIDLLPTSIRDQDPWALVALARRLLAEGSLDRAAEMYQRAVDRLEQHGAGREAADELRTLQAWVNPRPGVGTDWVHVARSVLAEPRKQVRRSVRAAAVTDELLLGYAHLVCGELSAAREQFSALAREHELASVAETAVLVGQALTRTLADPDDAGAEDGVIARDQAVAATKLLGLPVVSRLAHGLQAVAADDRTTIEYLLGECRQAEDRWGHAVLRLLAELAALATGAASAELLESVERDLRELAAPALAGWAAAAAALAHTLAGQPLPPPRLAAVELEARAIGPLPYALALLAIAGSQHDDRDGDRTGALALQVADRCGAGLLLRQVAARLPAGMTSPPAGAATTPAGATLRIRCLGGYAVEIDGVPVDLAAVRPRHRELLRLLSLHANRSLHREHIIEWLWPGRHPERGQHSLQVAVSDLRKLLEPAAARGGSSRLRRDESGYRLVLDSYEDCDVRRLDHHMRAARAAADDDTLAVHLKAVIAAYTGELLPDDGPAEWAVPERERLRNDLTEACERLAALRAGEGAHAEAVRLARHGLAQDRYRDGLWQRLIASLRAGGNPAEAAAAATAYRQVLDEMGLKPR